MKIDVVCPQCRTVSSFSDIVPFRAECDACSADLHVCLSCRFYDRYVENECREDEAELVPKKDRANLCEYYKPLAIGAGDAAVDEAAKAKAKLEALFGGVKPAAAPSPTRPGPSSSAADEAKRKLEELFKKK
jgi:hypothetical protein